MSLKRLRRGYGFCARRLVLCSDDTRRHGGNGPPLPARRPTRQLPSLRGFPLPSGALGVHNRRCLRGDFHGNLDGVLFRIFACVLGISFGTVLFHSGVCTLFHRRQYRKEKTAPIHPPCRARNRIVRRRHYRRRHRSAYGAQRQYGRFLS